MRCQKVRRNLTERADDSGPIDVAVQHHLQACVRCREFETEIRRAWRALEFYPSVETSQDFAEKFYARLNSSPRAPESTVASWIPRFGWQWMALAATALIVGIFLTVRPPHQLEYDSHYMSMTDRWDDQFLQDLEKNMSQWESTYVPVYDSWPESLLEPSFQESLPSP